MIRSELADTSRLIVPNPIQLPQTHVGPMSGVADQNEAAGAADAWRGVKGRRSASTESMLGHKEVSVTNFAK